MQEKDVSLCKKIITILNDAEETVWYFRQQYSFKGSIGLQRVITMLQEVLQNIVEISGETVLNDMGIKMLLNAQETGDEILIADVLEGQLIPCLENLVQQLEQQIPIEEFEVLQLNLDFMRQNGQETLADQIESGVGLSDCTYAPEYTRSGQITIRLEENNHSYYLSGNNNPFRDAIYFVHGNMEENKYRYVILGAGMFYESEALLRHRSDAEVMVVEEDPYLLRMALTFRDVTSLLADERISFVCDEYAKFLGENITDEQCILIRKPSMLHMRDLQCREVLETFFLKSMTIKEQAYVLEKEFRLNMKHIDEIHSIDECKGDFENRTMYLVAGGPSLDNTMDMLKNREDNSIVMCVGTAAAKLKGEGIVPEYVIITDVAVGMYDRIHGNVDEQKTKLFYMISANAKAVESFDGEKYAIFQKGFDMAEEYAAERGYTLVSTGGSVSTTALEIGIRLGCRKIVCLGLDLAYTNNVTHASGTIGYRKIQNDSNTLPVESVTGEMILTTNNLNSYRKWIENRIRNEKNVEFINVSNGAYIDGMKNVPIDKGDKL